MESIYLSNNQIGNNGAAELAESLMKHEAMKKIILGKYLLNNRSQSNNRHNKAI